MNDEIPPTLHFPDRMELAAQRGREFQKLSPEERASQIIALMAFGINMARSSPHWEAIEARWKAQEEEWREIQRRLFAEYEAGIAHVRK